MTGHLPLEAYMHLQYLWETADLPAEKIGALYDLNKNQIIGLANRRKWVKFAEASYYTPKGAAITRLPVDERFGRQQIAARDSKTKHCVVSRPTRRALKAAGLEAEISAVLLYPDANASSISLSEPDIEEEIIDDDLNEPWPYERTMAGRLDTLHAKLDAVLSVCPPRRPIKVKKQAPFLAKRYG